MKLKIIGTSVMALCFGLLARAETKIPKKLICSKKAYTIVCQPNLPMPCPTPPVEPPQVFAQKDIYVTNYDKQIYGKVTIVSDIEIQGHAFNVIADASFLYYKENNVLKPSMRLELYNVASEWTQKVLSDSKSVTTSAEKTIIIDDSGKIQSDHGEITCIIE